MPNVGHHADDGGVFGRAIEPDAFAHRISSGVEAFGESLIGNDYRWTARGIATIENPASHKRNSHGAEIVGRYHTERIGESLSRRRLRLAFEQYRREVRVGRQRQRSGNGGRFHAGQRS